MLVEAVLPAGIARHEQQPAARCRQPGQKQVDIADVVDNGVREDQIIGTTQAIAQGVSHEEVLAEIGIPFLASSNGRRGNIAAVVAAGLKGIAVKLVTATTYFQG